MAEYKVPQDVEADDKLIGFLSMKQFIFVIVAVMLTFAAFQLGRVSIFLVIPFIPFILVFGLLGLYQRKDQPVEVYLLAVLGFYLKPHKRIWDQDGMMETVRITVPKKIEAHYSDGLSKTEVKSRLSRLSTLMDTRGWAAKNAIFQTNVVVPSAQISDERLIAPIQNVPTGATEVHEADDMLDTANNPTAQKFDEMVAQAAHAAHQHAVASMHNDSDNSTAPTPAPGYNPYPSQMHQKVMQPAKQQSSVHEDKQPALADNAQTANTSTMTPPTPDAILDLANRRDDNISVETIAKEADRLGALDNNETISLH